ncbi:hypothetical protein MCEMZLE22_00898 [actinobacterium SCGC AAA044-D11]|uniref:Unannotated protein n=1 Tax=freshwater metagenome TaxID=449393 RepID=A0A6J6AYW1_9ZZZZ|nr:hypothetical protein [Actinomycetota bacterium]MTA24384.1 hypothetical protein [Actinomycetota bacterium]
MNRKSFDKIASVIGLLLAGFLIVLGGILQFGGNFAAEQVATQLKPQAITIPADNGDPKASADVKKFFVDNADKVMTTGKQAQMYADHYIGFHLSAMPTYAAASTENRVAAGALAADPTNAELQAKSKQAAATVETVFKGQALRGMLLNAYAFGMLGDIAIVASYVTFAGGLLFLILALLGFAHLRRVDTDSVI